MTYRGYHGLTVWNRAVDLVEMVYHLTDTLRSTAAAEVPPGWDVLSLLRESAFSAAAVAVAAPAAVEAQVAPAVAPVGGRWD